MNDSHYVKIEIDEKGATVKIRARRAEIVQAVSVLIGNCIEEDLFPDLPETKIPVGAKIGSAISAGIDSTTLSLGSMRNVYSDLIDVLITQLTNIINVKTMKGEN